MFFSNTASDVVLAVLELEDAAATAARGVRHVELRRPGQGVGGLVEVVVGLAVGRVELGADVRVVGVGRALAVALDRRVRIGAGQGAVDRVVGRVGLDLEADRVEQQLRGRVVVDVHLEADPVDQLLERLRLRLGAGAGAAVGLAREVARRALVVVVPVRREVAVRVDAVLVGRDLPVVVVVAQVLAPEAVVGRERVVVAVRVGDGEEPQLVGVDDLGDLLLRRAVDRGRPSRPRQGRCPRSSPRTGAGAGAASRWRATRARAASTSRASRDADRPGSRARSW